MNWFETLQKTSRPYLIAEAGVNHNGDIRLAHELIDVAKASGADAVKFQTFVTENLMSPSAPLADYQKKSGELSQFEMAKQLELSFDDFITLKKYAEKQGITFLSTPDEEESLEFLVSLNLEAIKVGSGELTNLPFLRLIAKANRPVILSTGMSTLVEIEKAVSAIRSLGNHQIVLLHCVSEYPAPFADVNLKAMQTMRETFQLPVGFSDHTLGFSVSLAAAALGASVIEKHFTLDKSMKGPDHACSLEPSELKALADGLKEIALAMGNGIKVPAPSELKNREVVRKSIVAKKDISAGEVLTEHHFAFKRSGGGIEPSDADKLIGLKLKKNIKKDSPLEWSLLEHV
ncbi:MAG: N-acetylneuraminate synthase [Deltaproteobacteria bacterium]|nr:N-acetylneuraminate synthase [Deltaproteobacteria bacterium]